MMSDLPGEITKQILSAPPRIMRSTRYSLTAQGRSTPPSRRLPTGRSSFEKASGWMRLPRPAAGTMPHMLRPPSASRRRDASPAAPTRAAASKSRARVRRRVLRERRARGALAAMRCSSASPRSSAATASSRRPRRPGSRGPGSKKASSPSHAVRQDRRAAGGGLEQPARGAPAHLGHGLRGSR